MKNAKIIIRRYPYEEPHHLNLVLSATNGDFSGSLRYYCNATDINELGSALIYFPKKIPDEYQYQLGSMRPEDHWAYFLLLRAYTIDLAGHSAIQISMNNNAETPDGNACTFSIKATSTAIKKLGEVLLSFSKLEHLELQWTSLGESSLHKNYSEEM